MTSAVMCVLNKAGFFECGEPLVHKVQLERSCDPPVQSAVGCYRNVPCHCSHFV